MNQKEVSELRRRFSLDKNSISNIYGCYVNGSGETILNFTESLGLLGQEETEKYLSLLKKSMSGGLGKNLIDIVFSTEQVMESEEHKLLSELRRTKLSEEKLRETFFNKVIEALDFEGLNYLILLAHDTYDVPFRGRDGSSNNDNSDKVFSYIVCAICPVKDGKVELGYAAKEKEFHSRANGQIVSAPELGFLFPAFDDRTANIYNALFYTRNTDVIQEEFLSTIFNTEPPMSASTQKEIFEDVLSEALDELCDIDTMQSIHEQIAEKIEQHKETKDPEPLTLSTRQISAVLEECAIPQERIETFKQKCSEQFGEGVGLNPSNIIDAKRFEIKTEQATITVSPESSYMVETKVINGRKYILIPADNSVEVNGLPVNFKVNESSEEEIL